MTAPTRDDCLAELARRWRDGERDAFETARRTGADAAAREWWYPGCPAGSPEGLRDLIQRHQDEARRKAA